MFLLFLLRKYGCKDAECITREVLKTLEIKEDKLTVEDIFNPERDGREWVKNMSKK